MPASIAVYKSRTESAIKDFAAYKTNPLSFKPKVGQRKKESKAPPSVSTGQSEPIRSVASVPSFQAEDNIFPIPLRQNLTVRIAGIPADLTSAEARKISNVIMALAMAD